MPTPTQAKPISITATNAHSGASVIAYNRTTGERKVLGTVSGGKALAEINNLDSGWTIGDVVEFRINGAYFGAGTVTLTSAAKVPQNLTITMTQSTTTNAPAISF